MVALKEEFLEVLVLFPLLDVFLPSFCSFLPFFSFRCPSFSPFPWFPLFGTFYLRFSIFFRLWSSINGVLNLTGKMKKAMTCHYRGIMSKSRTVIVGHIWSAAIAIVVSIGLGIVGRVICTIYVGDHRMNHPGDPFGVHKMCHPRNLFLDCGINHPPDLILAS